ncbi:hypothetical protein [Rhizobium tropici]|uniref:hypothetical protein n=1 Tax=Rhizobium tropici TaxID=398 RepID=UPI00165FD1F5|nr:hypothetical protein [Rhizobium tropici]
MTAIKKTGASVRCHPWFRPDRGHAEVTQFLKDALAAGAAPVERRFCYAINEGEIQSDFPMAARARYSISPLI